MVKKKQKSTETDSAYFLKLVLYVVLGTFWLKFADPIQVGAFLINGFPLGLLLGIIFASHDHFQVDRKIEYAILIVMTVLSYFLPAGIIL
jgi:hypothetical protein